MPRKYPQIWLEILGIIIFTMVLVASPTMAGKKLCCAAILVIVVVIVIRWRAADRRYQAYQQFRKSRAANYR